MSQPKTHPSKIFSNFKEIESNAWHSIIYYFDDNKQAIKQLEFNEYFEVLVVYVNALFEAGKYEKHLKVVDEVIETSIIQNIKYYNGEDLYYQMLFRKAASYFQTLAYDQADYILRELLKINPTDVDVAIFLKKCLHKNTPSFVRNARALSVLLFLLTAIIISLEVLVVRNFYIHFQSVVEATRNGLFLLGWGILLFAELYHRWNVHREVRCFLKNSSRT